jgi:hypothetical protein
MRNDPNYRFLRRIRLFLMFSRIDVQIGSGVRVSRLAAAESGRGELTAPELACLSDFYQRHLQLVREREGIPGWPPEFGQSSPAMGHA